MQLTEAEIATERRCIVETRLAILCGTRPPTREQTNIALREANDWEDQIRLEMWKAKKAPCT